MPKTSIEWTDVSWPVLNGCRRISLGCLNCYAERLAATRLRNTDKYRGLAMYTSGGPRWTGESRLWAKELAMPLRLRKPSRIFVCDMGDLFYEGNSNEEIAAVFGVMAACPQHTFQVLTKRAERLPEWFRWLDDEARDHAGNIDFQHTLAHAYAEAGSTGSDDDLDGLFWRLTDRHNEAKGDREDIRWPLQNVWLGVSAEDQKRADERIPHLLATPAAVRFVSLEPLLGSIDLTRIQWCQSSYPRDAIPDDAPEEPEIINALTGDMRDGEEMFRVLHEREYVHLDWVIVGSESGHGARPMEIDWARDIVDQCCAAGVAVFTKQIANAHDRKGGNPEHWPTGIWPREFPHAS